MAQIFISYAREDRDKVCQLAQFLEHRGWSVWWDRHLLPGQDFHRRIQRELTQASCIIVVWSKAALDSSFVEDEAREGAASGRLVPVLFEEVVPPLGLRGLQAADLTSWPSEAVEATAMLVDAVHHVLSSAGHPRIIPAARGARGISGMGRLSLKSLAMFVGTLVLLAGAGAYVWKWNASPLKVTAGRPTAPPFDVPPPPYVGAPPRLEPPARMSTGDERDLWNALRPLRWKAPFDFYARASSAGQMQGLFVTGAQSRRNMLVEAVSARHRFTRELACEDRQVSSYKQFDPHGPLTGPTDGVLVVWIATPDGHAAGQAIFRMSDDATGAIVTPGIFKGCSSPYDGIGAVVSAGRYRTFLTMGPKTVQRVFEVRAGQLVAAPLFVPDVPMICDATLCMTPGDWARTESK